jgi:hypothetical protein
MMKLDAVATFVSGLPDVVVGTKWGNHTWMVGTRVFAWQRAFSKADLKRFGTEAPPAGDILAVVTAGLDAKEALLEIAPSGFFTIPHFDGYAAVLIALRAARAVDVKAAIVDAWQCVAPPATRAKLAKPRRRAGAKRRA